ncbi:hypothetical protein BL132_00012235, partial [Klebsiella pneumoniae]
INPLLPKHSQIPLKFISNYSHPTLTRIPITIHLSSNKCPISTPQLFPQSQPPAFPYIPESFNQCLFITHPLRSQILISSIFL